MMERTLILAKPDAVQRGLVGEIVKRFEQKGFRIAGIKMVHPNAEQLGTHYADDPEWKKAVATKTREVFAKKGVELKETDEEIGQRVRRWNMEGLSNPIVAIVFEGLHAVEMGRKIVGHTEPKSAAVGTIRGDFSIDSFQRADKDQRTTRNLIHASGTVEEADREIKIWFNNEELYDFERHDWQIIHK